MKNMAKIGQKNFNVYVDEKVANAFSEQIDERGYTKYRAVEGALRAFIAIPPEVQVELMSNPPDGELEELLQKSYALSNDQIEKLWTEMERIAKKVGVKIKRNRG